MVELAETSLISLGEDFSCVFDDVLTQTKQHKLVERLWQKDTTLWSSDADTQEKIAHRLGWLDSLERVAGSLGDVQAWVNTVRDAGYRDVLLLGMGGSSLCPLVLAEVFVEDTQGLNVHVLDTTDALTIERMTQDLDWSKTIVVLASKSGGTIEALSLYAYCRSLADAKTKFVAITDPQTSLVALAKRDGFAQCLENPADIGGRYSALSHFGFFPALCLGIDFKVYAEHVDLMLKACQIDVKENPGLELAVFMAAAYRSGRDKLCLEVGDSLKCFPLWIEQLVAESLGKKGKGVIPVAGAELEDFVATQRDRYIVAIGDAQELETIRQKHQANTQNGTPLLTIEVKAPHQLGAEFFRWEMATALAGFFLEVNPFDEPNVTESKMLTQEILDEYATEGKLRTQRALASSEHLELYGTLDWGLVAEPGAVLDVLRAFVGQAEPNDFIGLLAYLPYAEQEAFVLADLRRTLSSGGGWLTTLGYGPRFLHSTGQLHKGGANNGVFLQLTCADAIQLPIPGVDYSFGVLKSAQAAGDMRALEKHGRRVLRCHLQSTVEEGLTELKGLLKQIFTG